MTEADKARYDASDIAVILTAYGLGNFAAKFKEYGMEKCEDILKIVTDEDLKGDIGMGAAEVATFKALCKLYDGTVASAASSGPGEQSLRASATKLGTTGASAASASTAGKWESIRCKFKLAAHVVVAAGAFSEGSRSSPIVSAPKRIISQCVHADVHADHTPHTPLSLWTI